MSSENMKNYVLKFLLISSKNLRGILFLMKDSPKKPGAKDG